MSRGSTDSLNSPAHRHSMSRTPSRDHRTTDSHQSTPRPRVRSNSTPDKRLSTSSHTAATSIDHHKNQDRKTWSAGPASPVVRGAPSPVQRSPSTAARNQSQTNLQLHRSVSNSPSTPTNRQRTSSTLSTHTAPTISRRYSRSSQHLPTRQRPILFYHKHEPHYGFTNFSNHGVKYADKVYPTSEHLFQSLKFAHRPLLAEHIRTCDTRPSVAFSEARRFQPEVRKDWKQYNIQAMDLTLWFKFNQHKDLKEELLATGDAELIENSDKDAFWGCGADGKGKNELGKALVRLRTKLRG